MGLIQVYIFLNLKVKEIIESLPGEYFDKKKCYTLKIRKCSNNYENR